MNSLNCCFFFLQFLFLLKVSLGEKAFKNETDFRKIIEKKNNMQSFERIREVLEKHKASESVIDTISPLSSTSVSSGYMILSEYQGSSASCDGTPVYYTGVVLGLCVAVNSGYPDLPYGCSSSGSYVKLTSTYDSTTVYLTYSYYSSSACSTSCGSYTYEYTNGCAYLGYDYGTYITYSISFSSNMVVPSTAGILKQEYVSSSCSGTLAGYTFEPSICRIYYSESFKLTCSSDTNTQQLDVYYYNTQCSGAVSKSETYDLSYSCDAYPYAIITDRSSNISMNNADNSSNIKDSSYYYYESLETTFYKQTCKSASSSSSSSSKLSQVVVIAVSVVSVFASLVW
jgi:hypothetical protein